MFMVTVLFFNFASYLIQLGKSSDKWDNNKRKKEENIHGMRFHIMVSENYFSFGLSKMFKIKKKSKKKTAKKLVYKD